MIQLKNVYKNYFIGKEEIPILKDISLEIEQGEFIVILGQSGCGKTTLLNLIAGMDKMKKGSMVFQGSNMEKFRDKQWSQWRKHYVGYIFQNFNLIEFLTAKQNIELVLQLNGVAKKERSKKADELLEMVGLKERGRHLPSQLSGGQKQRVAIARALANNPSLLLADEPTGAVDSENAKDIMNLLHRINREKGVTVIMVTHDTKLAEQADRKINMLDGRIIADIEQKESERPLQIKERSIQKQTFSKWSSMTVAYRNIITKKKRTILTTLGTAIGIMGVLLVFGIGSGAKGRILKEIGTIANNRVVDVMETDKVMSEEIQKELLSDEAVINVYPNYLLDVVCQYGDKVCGAMVKTIAPLDNPLPYWQDNILYGEMPKADDSNEVMITSTMAEILLEDGENIENILGKEINMVFIVSTSEQLAYQVEFKGVVSGISGKSFLGVEMVNVPYITAEKLAKASMHNEDYRSDRYCVTVAEEKQAQRIKDKLTNMGFKASIDEEALGTIGTMIDMVTAVIMLIAGISLIVSGIMIALVTYMGVVERTREIGILRAIGFAEKEVRIIFETEGGIIGFLAGLFGVVFASLLGAAVNAVIAYAFPEVAFTLFEVNLGQVLFCILFSIGLGWLCSFSPARKAAKMNPVKALGYVE